MPDTSNLFTDGLGMAGINPDTLAIPKQRIGNAEAARAIYSKAVSDDEKASRNRKRIRGLLNGNKPLKQEALETTGQHYRANFNDGTAKRLLEVIAGELVQSTTESGAIVSVKTTIGTPEQQSYFNYVLSDEISRAIMRWKSYHKLTTALAQSFVWDGVGIVMWEDNENWQWTVGSFQDFLFIRDTKPDESRVEIMFARRDVHIRELLDDIEDEEAAKAAGWNVDNVLKVCAHIGSGTSEKLRAEDLETIRKCSSTTAVEKNNIITLVHCLVQEYDGSVTHLIFTEANDSAIELDNDGWLYKAENAYENMAQAITLYTYGVGTENLLHSIRGLGYDQYDILSTMNKHICHAVDAGKMGCSLVLQSDGAMEQMNYAIQPMGPVAYISPNAKPVDVPNINLAATIIPSIQLLQSLSQERSGKYSPLMRLTGGERSSAEIQAERESMPKLNKLSQDEWFICCDSHLTEVVRRMVQNYNEFEDKEGKKTKHDDESREKVPGGHIVNRILKKLRMRDVPEEAFWAIDWEDTEAIRPIAKNFTGGQAVALAEIQPFVSEMDDVGRQYYMFDFLASRVGPEKAKAYLPPNRAPRTPNGDFHQPRIENNQMIKEDGSGQPYEAADSDNHLAHLKVHIKAADSIFNNQQNHQISAGEAYLQMRFVVEHISQHISYIDGSNVDKEVVNSLKKQVQHYGEVMNNGQKELQKQQQEQEQMQAQQAAQAQQAEQQGEISARQQQRQEELAHLKARNEEDERHASVMGRIKERQEERSIANKRLANITSLGEQLNS